MTVLEQFENAKASSEKLVSMAEGLENLAKWIREYAETGDGYTKRAIEEVLLEIV